MYIVHTAQRFLIYLFIQFNVKKYSNMKYPLDFVSYPFFFFCFFDEYDKTKIGYDVAGESNSKLNITRVNSKLNITPVNEIYQYNTFT